jgi:putative transposase
MVQYRRNFVPGGTYFFTVALEDRQSSTLVDYIAMLRTSFRAARKERPFQIDAIVILPDHLHAIFTLPADDADFSARWRRIKSDFTRQLNSTGVSISRHQNGEYALWQRRFWEHTIRDESDFERHLDYIHFNPVKHGHVASVNDWPHSSFHAFVRRGLLPAGWAGRVEERTRPYGERAD